MANKSKQYKEPEAILKIRNEIIMAEQIIEDMIVPKMQEVIRKYTGDYRPEVPMDVYLNEIYPIVQYELPAIFFKTPRAILKPRSKGYYKKVRDLMTGEKTKVFVEGQKSARTQEHILNYSLGYMKYKKQMRRVLLDALLFPYGAMWHGYKGNFGMTEENSFYIRKENVFVKRLSPTQVIFDPKVSIDEIEEGDWVGRKFDIPLQDVKEDDRLFVSKEIKSKQGFGSVLTKDNPFLNRGEGQDKINATKKPTTLLDYTEKEYRSHAHYITIYEIFAKPTKKEEREGKKGKLYLLTDAQREPLRENDWPYKIDDWSLKVLAFNQVPERRYGMPDIDVWGEIAYHKNLIHNLQLRNAETNSKVITFFDKTNLEDDTIKSLESGQQTIVGVNGSVKDKISMASPGGQASSELYIVDGRIQQNLDEKSGVNDLKKGSLRSGEESATSVRIRNAGSSSRPAYRQDIMVDFLKDSFKFLNDLNQQFMPIKEAVRITGSLDIEWSENPDKDEIQQDVDVEIDVISMLPESPERELAENKQVLELMYNALVTPQIMQKLMQERKTFNVAPILEQILVRLKIRNPEVFRNVRPEESLGFAPVAELRMAQANVEALKQGAQLPYPPDEGQAHQVRMGYYQAIKRLEAIEGRVNQALDQLIAMQAEIAEEEAKRTAPRAGQTVKLSKSSITQPTMEGVG